MTIGIRSRVPASEYFDLPGVSITRLKEMRRSPQHYLYRMDHPTDTEPMRLGTAAHTAVLEPERFNRDFAVWGERTDSGNLRPRRGKDWTAFAQSYPGKTIITHDEFALVIPMAEAVRTNPIASPYLSAGDPEVTMQWMLGERQCRGRVDWLTMKAPVDQYRNRVIRYSSLAYPCIVGLKTARDCRHFIFGNAAAKLGYHLQWAFYFDGYKEITGHTPKMVEIVVESAPPHAVAVYTIPKDIIDQGRDEYLALMKQLDECETTGYFPGPQEEEESLTLPSWRYQTEDDLSDLGLEA